MKQFLAVVVLVLLAAQAFVVPVLPADAAGRSDRVPSPAPAHAHARDRVLVGFKARASAAKRRRAVRTPAVAAVETVSPIASDVVVVELRPGVSVSTAIAEIGSRRGVAYVEPDYLVRPAASADDPWYTSGEQWGMYGDETVPHANPFGSGAGEAWADGHVGRSEVHVGVVDEGVRVDHPDLAANIWHNPWEVVNGADDDGNGYVDDVHGWDFYHDDASVYDGTADDHGTHVAGTIGARGGNGIGVAGLSWRVTLVTAKFMGPGGGYISDAVRALDYLTDLRLRHGLRVVAANASWEGGGFSQSMLVAIERAGDAGILFVAAAGNAGRDIDTAASYPASYQCQTRADGSPRGWDCLVSVASLEPDGDLNPESNWGTVSVDLAAPGTDIVSTHPGAVDYARSSGTSMAAPHVSGAIALCAAIDATLGPAALMGSVLGTTRATPSLQGVTSSGGRLDVGALASWCEPPEPTPTPGPTPNPTSTPTDPPAGAVLTVDELDGDFAGTGSAWNEAATGYAGHHLWVTARQTTKLHLGVWRASLEPGRYEVLAKVPKQHATSGQVTYKILTDDGWVIRFRSQLGWQGQWMSLGTHVLGAEAVVRLSDKTGESATLDRRVAFDAIRFVPVPDMDQG